MKVDLHPCGRAVRPRRRTFAGQSVTGVPRRYLGEENLGSDSNLPMSSI